MMSSRRRRDPVPRSRSGMIGRRYERTGTEPVTARSALGLRLILSCAGVVLFAALTALFAVWAAGAGPDDSPSRWELGLLAGGCGLLTVVAAVDLVVILRRRGRERPRG
ncbi:DUF6343 family protein [Streptomyces sp. NPDC048389]|uniref:DUF6343 family protein n=1 Tax=Streptomyces sp. NPDC048389 TaxID=3154622 RepID=UPI0034512D5F